MLFSRALLLMYLPANRPLPLLSLLSYSLSLSLPLSVCLSYTLSPVSPSSVFPLSLVSSLSFRLSPGRRLLPFCRSNLLSSPPFVSITEERERERARAGEKGEERGHLQTKAKKVLIGLTLDEPDRRRREREGEGGLLDQS